MSDISFDQAKENTRKTMQILGWSRTVSALVLATVNAAIAAIVLVIGLNRPVVSAMSLGFAWGVLSTGVPLALYLRQITQP